MELHLIRPATTERGDETIPIGEVVEYLGHLPGGMVQVRWHGVSFVIHPATTKELS